jgi:hypothetical protein
MATHRANLDALIRREDLEVKTGPCPSWLATVSALSHEKRRPWN